MRLRESETEKWGKMGERDREGGRGTNKVGLSKSRTDGGPSKRDRGRRMRESSGVGRDWDHKKEDRNRKAETKVERRRKR